MSFAATVSPSRLSSMATRCASFHISTQSLLSCVSYEKRKHDDDVPRATKPLMLGLPNTSFKFGAAPSMPAEENDESLQEIKRDIFRILDEEHEPDDRDDDDSSQDPRNFDGFVDAVAVIGDDSSFSEDDFDYEEGSPVPVYPFAHNGVPERSRLANVIPLEENDDDAEDPASLSGSWRDRLIPFEEGEVEESRCASCSPEIILIPRSESCRVSRDEELEDGARDDVATPSYREIALRKPPPPMKNKDIRTLTALSARKTPIIRSLYDRFVEIARSISPDSHILKYITPSKETTTPDIRRRLFASDGQ